MTREQLTELKELGFNPAFISNATGIAVCKLHNFYYNKYAKFSEEETAKSTKFHADAVKFMERWK
jgi:hypothetical protein